MNLHRLPRGADVILNALDAERWKTAAEIAEETGFNSSFIAQTIRWACFSLVERKKNKKGVYVYRRARFG